MKLSVTQFGSQIETEFPASLSIDDNTTLV